MIAVVHHPDYVAEAPSPSAYRWNKNGLIRDLLLAERGVVAWHQPEPMPCAWIEAVHDPDYVAEVLNAKVPPEKERRIGFKVNEVMARRSPLVVGGTWRAALLALERGYAANSAGGSHHALAATGAGYCIFNDLAIVAVRLVEQGVVERVMVVDCDVHQGDGTAALTPGGRISSPIRSMPRRIFRCARRARRSMSRCPTGPATSPISTRWKSRWRRCSTANGPISCSIRPASIRSVATGSGGCR